MFTHQPGNQLAVSLIQTVCQAEFFCIGRAQFFMATTASLGDIMEQARKIE